MSKDIHTPRKELICGAIDRAEDIARDHSLVYLLDELARIRNHAERMEAKLVSRKQEAERYELYVQALKSELAALKAGQGEAITEVSAETFSSDGTSDIITCNLPIGTKLYLSAPPASAGARLVPVELLRDICSLIPEKMKPARKEIRDLLAQSQGVK